MADLDDFFAKRDKTKKSKKKFDTTEDVAKILEQKAKEKKKLETGKSNYSESGRQSPGPGVSDPGAQSESSHCQLPAVGDDDEWLEAEDKQPDFSNLKIQELVLTSDEEEDPSQSAVEGEGEAGVDGPWKTKNKKGKKDKEGDGDKEEETPAETTDTPKPDEDKDVKPEEEEEKEESSKEEKQDAAPEKPKYVPPSLRNKPAASSSSYVPPAQRIPAGSAAAGLAKKKGAAPALADEESFPSLN